MCKFFTIACFRLSNLIFVMRENQIFPAGMDIDLLAQIFSGHLRTLNVPARAALAPWCVPVRLSVLFRFPEYEIQRIFLFILA